MTEKIAILKNPGLLRTLATLQTWRIPNGDERHALRMLSADKSK
jgi:hypothetical protein